MKLVRHCLPLLLLTLPAAPTSAADSAPSRGQLLYATHCIACHTQQVHWRDSRAATDWSKLVAQVRRWQDVQKLGWNAADIDEVARHLNALHYHYPTPN